MEMDAAFLQKLGKENDDPNAQKQLVKVLKQIELNKKLLMADGLDVTFTVDQNKIGTSQDIQESLDTVKALEKDLISGGVLDNRVAKIEQLQNSAKEMHAAKPAVGHWLSARVLLQQRWAETVSKKYE